MLVLIWIALPNVSSILFMVHVPHRSPLKWFRLYTSPYTSQWFRAHPVWLHSCSVARSFISRLSSGYVLVEGSRAWPFLSNIWDSGLVVVLILRKVQDSNLRCVRRFWSMTACAAGFVILPSSTRPTFQYVLILIILVLENRRSSRMDGWKDYRKSSSHEGIFHVYITFLSCYVQF